MSTDERERWLKDSQDYFRDAQSYHGTVVTLGYATFFALLAFLDGKVNSKLLFIAGLLVAISAAIFVAYVLFEQISQAIKLRRLGKEGNHFFRFWALFFIPSVLLAAAGTTVLVILFVSRLHAP